MLKPRIKNNYTIGGVAVFCLVVLALSPSFHNLIANSINPQSFIKFTQKKSSISNSNDIEYDVVSRVVDGDTIVLGNGHTVRYLYIDTPETVKPNAPVECYGPEAKMLNSILVEGREVALLRDVELKDAYGRDLRIVFTKGVDTRDVSQSINAQMVRKGYAKAKIFYPNNRFEKEFNKFEMEAADNKKGLWGYC